MNVLAFISQIIDSVVWPIASIVIVFLIRKDLGNLLSRARRIKYKDAELELGEEIKAAKAEADETLPDITTTESRDMAYKLAAYSSRAAIIEAWFGVEEALNNYAQRHNMAIDPRKPFTIQNLILHQTDYGDIGKSIVATLQRLRKIRNEAVHLKDIDISSSEAEEYIDLAQRVIQHIEAA